MKIKVQVIEQDLKECNYGGQCCPVALATKRAFKANGLDDTLHITKENILKYVHMLPVLAKLPVEVRYFIQKFDNLAENMGPEDSFNEYVLKYLRPFEFEIEVTL